MKPVMKPFYFLVMLFVGASLAMADPTTMPTVAANGPPGGPSVLMIPFRQVGEASSHQWVSGAIQENLLTAAAAGGLQTMALDRPLALSDSAEALRIARDYNAVAVVFGSYQFSEGQIRVNGEVADVASGHVVGTLQANGALIDLFKIEDALGAQVRPLLPQTQNTQPPPMYGANPMNGSNPAEAATADNSIQQIYPNTTTDQSPQVAAVPYPYPYPYTSDDYGYSYPYASSDYGYGAPYYGYGWGYPYVIVGGGGFFGRGGFFPHGRVGVHGGFGGFRGGAGFHGGVGFAARGGGGRGR